MTKSVMGDSTDARSIDNLPQIVIPSNAIRPSHVTKSRPLYITEVNLQRANKSFYNYLMSLVKAKFFVF